MTPLPASFIKVDDANELSNWVNLAMSRHSSPISKSRFQIVLTCIKDRASSLEGGQMIAWDDLISDLQVFKPNIKPKSVATNALSTLTELADLGVITRGEYKELGRRNNNKYPLIYTINKYSIDATVFAAKNTGANENLDRTAPLQAGLDLTLSLKENLKKSSVTNYTTESDLSVPANMRLSTLLVAHGSRTTKTDTRLEVITSGTLMADDVSIRSYTSGRTDSQGKELGRMYSHDAIILYLMQSRDSQLVAKKLAAGETDIPNRFTVDAQDIARELQHDKKKPNLFGNTIVSVSNAIFRISQMNYEIEMDSGSELAKSLTSRSGAPSNTIHLKHFTLETSGEIDGNQGGHKIRRFFTYSYPEHVFNSMLSSNGMWVFHKNLINRRQSGYESTLYFWLRSVCSQGQTTSLTLSELYILINFDDWIGWNKFANYFLKQVLNEDVFPDGSIDVGQSGTFDFFGYDLTFERPDSGLRTIRITAKGARITEQVKLTKQIYGETTL
jgi:hypothetical protein